MNTTTECGTCHGTRDIPHTDWKGRDSRVPCPDCAYRKVITKADVTDADLEEVWNVVEGWYIDQPIDWEDVYSRVERYPQSDGLYINFGTEVDTPAMRYIQSKIRKWKREATD